MSAASLICIIGAESTGKTTLAQALAQHFNGLWVPEYLRAFCQTRHRTPTRAEQSLILETQFVDECAARVLARQQQAQYVFCDTAPLLTAIYSEFVFGDTALYPRARALHTRYALTLFLQPDIAWVADGVQRDGEQVRAPVTQIIARELAALGAPVVNICGEGEARFVASRDAVLALAAAARP